MMKYQDIIIISLLEEILDLMEETSYDKMDELERNIYNSLSEIYEKLEDF